MEDDCEAACEANSQCNFFTNFSNGWCLLKASCDTEAVASDSTATTYQKDPSVTFTASGSFTDTLTFWTSTYRFEREDGSAGGYWLVKGSALVLKWDSAAAEELATHDFGSTLIGTSGLSMSNSNPPHWWTMQFQECTYTVTVGRLWGDDFDITVTSPAGSTFSVSGMVKNDYCRDNGFGIGSHGIVNQAGETVGAGTCRIEENWIVSATLESCAAATPITGSSENAANAGTQLTVLIVLCSSAMVLATALSYWRLRKRANCKCNRCMVWDKETQQWRNGQPINEIWDQEVSSGNARVSDGYGDGWDEPVLDEMPEDGVSAENDVDMEVDLAIIPVQDDGLAGIPPTYEDDSERDDEDIDVERDCGKYMQQQPCWEL
jgi:hypothetical protein